MRYFCCFVTTLWAVTLLLFTCAEAQTLAFPGAEGFGRFAKGGRGGRVIEVTNLNDSGPGSLRNALEATGARIVVFRVGGTITLNSDIEINHPFITIAGQTAPGDGIVIRDAVGATGDNTINIQASEVIMRFLRVRPGVAGVGSRGILIQRPEFPAENSLTNNIVIDHCSVSWVWDDNINPWGSPVRDVTIQWTITSESLNGCGAGCGGRGLLLGSGATRISVHHNLFAHNHQRSPLSKGGDVDIRNNVIYNFGGISGQSTVIRSRDGVTRANIIGNYYKWGPTGETLDDNEIRLKNDGFDSSSSVYLEDNLAELTNGTVEAATVVEQEGGFPINSSPFNFGSVTTTSATQALDKVLSKVGAWLPIRDAVDTRIINEVINGTGRLIKTENEVGGYPIYQSGTAPADTDHDGMPDAWETQNGLNPNSAADGPQDSDGDGYTNVEEYLNSLVTGSGHGNSPPTPPTNLVVGG